MKAGISAFVLGAALIAGPAWSQQADTGNGPDLDAFIALATGPCLFAETGDVATPFKAARDAAAGMGLMALSDTDQAAMFGIPLQQQVVVTRGVDHVACMITFAPPLGDHDAYKEVEAALDAEITARDPNHLESIEDDPSPHVDGHDWLLHNAANDALAVALDYSTERGVEIATSIKKQYD